MLKSKIKVAEDIIENSKTEFIELGKRKHVNQSKYTEVTNRLSIGCDSKKEYQEQLEVLEKKIIKRYGFTPQRYTFPHLN